MLINNVDDTVDYTLRWKYAGIPQKYWGRTLGHFVADDASSATALKWARGFVDTFRQRRKLDEDQRGLLGIGAAIVGPDAGRNTELMCAVLTEVHLTYGASVAYVSADTYLADHQEYLRLDDDKAKRTDNPERYRSLLTQHIRLRKVSLLAIDRLGQEWHGQSGYTGKVINRLTHQRYDTSRPTLVAGTSRPDDWTAYDKTFPAFAKQALPAVFLAGARNAR